jgi:hypothetical protein
MESQPLDEEGSYLIEKKNIQKWKSVTSHALKNRTAFSADIRFTDVDGEEQVLTVKPDQALLTAVWNCINKDDDDQVEAFNQFYYKIKCNTEQIIQYRKARGTYLKVRVDGDKKLVLCWEKCFTIAII